MIIKPKSETAQAGAEVFEVESKGVVKVEQVRLIKR